MVIDTIVIVDLGSKKNAELAREIRALGVYSEVVNYDVEAEYLANMSGLKGIIYNAGPNRIVDGTEVDVSSEVKNLEIPIMYVDYGGEADLPEEETARQEKLSDFIFNECKAEKNWSVENFIENAVAEIKEKVGDKKVLLALSGGVDSSVVAALLIKAIGKQLTCVHVNHGLLRKGEPEQVIEVFGKQLDANLVYVDASDRFLEKLAGVADPESKRKIIGKEFIEVFAEEAGKLNGIDFLAQGTIYPDIIESGSKTQNLVKSHHNVGGLPEDLQFELIEPVKNLFKDEVRLVGDALGLPHEMVYRQPFPGPGLGVRCVGAITRDRLEAVRESDAILREEIAKAGLDQSIWQYFTVVPEFRSTGIKNGKRSYDWPCIIRAVNTVDAMTAEPFELPYEVLRTLTYRITHEVETINRVLYDFTPKPTGTIEWE